MTGKYPWSNVDTKILPGNAALIIDTQKITLPKLMKQAGYTTGSVGKWHIGLGNGHVDWNKEVHPGAAEIGYDYSFIQAATNDRVPCVFLENGRVVGLDPNDPLYVDYRKNFPGEPTGKENPELLRMHPSVGHAGSIVTVSYTHLHNIVESLCSTFPVFLQHAGTSEKSKSRLLTSTSGFSRRNGGETG